MRKLKDGGGLGARWLAASIVGWLALALAASASWAGERVHAVIVANNGSTDARVKALKYADDDGARYWEMFSAMDARVRLLATLDADTQRIFEGAARASRPPTRQEVFKALREVQAEVVADKAAGHATTLFVVFAGHGAVDAEGQGTLSMLDGPLTRRELIDEVIAPDVADRTHLIIDACHAYFMVHERGGHADDRSGEGLDAEFEAFLKDQRVLSRYPRVGVLLSTAGAAEVHEWSEFQGGVFSHEVRSGLLGAADIDADGVVTYPEVEAWLEAANASVDDPRARIRVTVEAPQQFKRAELVRLSSFQRATMLSVEPGEAGHYHLADSRGVRYADFHAAGDGPMRMALLWSAPFFFVRTQDTEARLDREARGPVVSLRDLEFVARSAPRGPVEESYRANLFSVPFSKGFYTGYHAGRERGAGAASAEVGRALEAPGALRRVDLQLGALSAPAPLSSFKIDALELGGDLAASFWLGEHFALVAFGGYGTSADREQIVGGQPFRLHRVALGVGAQVGAQLAPELALGLELRTAHQWLIFTGGGQDQRLGDPFSWRGEGALTVGYALSEQVSVGVRAGVSLNLFSIAREAGGVEEAVDLQPFAGIFMGLRL